MNKENVALTNPDNTCCNCLKETTEIHQIKIASLSWGSQFDLWGTQINLCNSCFNLTDPAWWEFEIVKDESDWGGSYYKYEEEIFKYIKTMPLSGQELFWNRYSNGEWSSPILEPQDWINYELGTLSHKKSKSYGLYSPQEKQAYQEKFPTCQHPANRVYDDGSKGCWCPFGANGRYGQMADGYNISVQCYQCKQYVERKTSLIDIDNEDWNDYKTYYVALCSKIESRKV